MGRQLLILASVFLGAAAIALLLDAKNVGTAFGVGQVCFAAALVWILVRD